MDFIDAGFCICSLVRELNAPSDLSHRLGYLVLVEIIGCHPWFTYFLDLKRYNLLCDFIISGPLGAGY